MSLFAPCIVHDTTAVFLFGRILCSAVLSSAPLPVSWLQRVVSFSILCDLYRNDANGTNPFLPFFLEAIEKGTDPVERQYLVHLLCSPPTNRNVSIAASLLSVLGLPNLSAWQSAWQPHVEDRKLRFRTARVLTATCTEATPSLC